MQDTNHQAPFDLMSIFESDQKLLLRPREVSKMLGISTETIYDWKYRAKKRNIPDGLFIKFNSRLFIRSDVLNQWISSQIG